MSRRPARSRPGGTSALVPRVEELAVGPDPDPRLPPADTDQTPTGFPTPNTSELPESGSSEVPKYLQLTRRDARLRDDQVHALSALCRRITSSRPAGQRGERITDNTLIRVAIDLLLDRGEQVAGTTEAELRESALRPPDLKPPGRRPGGRAG